MTKLESTKVRDGACQKVKSPPGSSQPTQRGLGAKVLTLPSLLTLEGDDDALDFMSL